MAKKEAMTVVSEKPGKPIERSFLKQSELPNMPEGSVPQHIRDRAEDVVRMAMDVEQLRDELEKEEEKLLDQMVMLKIPVVVVVVGKSKKRIRTKTGKLKLVIEDAGIEQAPAAAKENGTEKAK